MTDRMSNMAMLENGISIQPIFFPDGSVDGWLVRVQRGMGFGTNTCFFGKDHKTIEEAYVASVAWAEGVISVRSA